MTGRYPGRVPLLAYLVAWLALTIGVALPWAPLIRLDQAVRDAVADPGNALAGFVTQAGAPPVIFGLTFVLLAVLARWRDWERFRLIAGIMFSLALFRWGVLWLLARPRPPGGAALGYGWSYPSGHAAYATAFAMTLFYLVCARAARPWQRHLLTVFVLAWPAAVAVTRVSLGAHWPIDVLAGVSLGVITVMAVSRLSHPAMLTADGYPAKTVRRQLNRPVGGEVRSKSGADPQR